MEDAMTRYSVLLIGLALLLAGGCGGEEEREPVPGSGLEVGDLLPISPNTNNTNNTTCTEGERSYIEGNPSCDAGPPAGGGCTCKNGAWDCWTSCHDSCPYSYDPSIHGTTCSFTQDEGSCIYWPTTGNYMQMTCDCINGKFDCQDI
jgi:hypothetical protein